MFTDVILLDFSEAFDKVPHQRLIHKLNYYGIRDKNLNWITDFLGNRQQQVLLNGCGPQSRSLLIYTPKCSLMSTGCNMWLCNL
jgi:hypothetical protein